MKKKKLVLAAAIPLLVLTLAYTAAAAAAGSADPVVTLSYLTGIFQPQMNAEMQQMVDSREQELAARFDEALQEVTATAEPEPEPSTEPEPGTEPEPEPVDPASPIFKVVTLKKGQVLTGDVGCEVMLRIGSATCSSSGSTGLIDTTDGTVLGNGKALVTNHLYMVTISTRSVVAKSATTKVLVRGPYTVS